MTATGGTHMLSCLLTGTSSVHGMHGSHEIAEVCQYFMGTPIIEDVTRMWKKKEKDIDVYIDRERERERERGKKLLVRSTDLKC